MFRPRVIPVLLLKNKGLVKSVNFKNYKYIGDPINAVKIFNDLRADELVFLDITATSENRSIHLELIKNIAEEANMPFAVGGGIKNLSDIKKIISLGAEKVVINTYAAQNPEFIKQASENYGSSTITVCMDVKKKLFGKETTWIMNGSKPTGLSPVEFAKTMQENGAGEIIVQSIPNDGLMNGYDLSVLSAISHAVTIPVVALGGAGNIGHLKQAFTEAHVNGLAAGSMFVFQGNKKGVLINYPDKSEIKQIF